MLVVRSPNNSLLEFIDANSFSGKRLFLAVVPCTPTNHYCLNLTLRITMPSEG